MAGPAAGAKAAAAPCTAVVAAALPGGPQPPCPALASRSGPHPGCRAENNARGCVRFPGRKREAPTNVVWIRRRHGLEGGTATGVSAQPRCAPDGIRPPPSPHGHGLPAPRASSAAPEPWPRSSSSLGSPFPAVLQPFPQPFPRARPPPARLRVRKLASPSPHARRPRPPPASAAPATGRGSTGRVGLADNARKAGRAGGPRRVTGGCRGLHAGWDRRHVPLHDGLPCTRACRDVPARAGLGVGAMPSPHDPTPPPPAPVRVAPSQALARVRGPSEGCRGWERQLRGGGQPQPQPHSCSPTWVRMGPVALQAPRAAGTSRCCRSSIAAAVPGRRRGRGRGSTPAPVPVPRGRPGRAGTAFLPTHPLPPRRPALGTSAAFLCAPLPSVQLLGPRQGRGSAGSGVAPLLPGHTGCAGALSGQGDRGWHRSATPTLGAHRSTAWHRSAQHSSGWLRGPQDGTAQLGRARHSRGWHGTACQLLPTPIPRGSRPRRASQGPQLGPRRVPSQAGAARMVPPGAACWGRASLPRALLTWLTTAPLGKNTSEHLEKQKVRLQLQEGLPAPSPDSLCRVPCSAPHVSPPPSPVRAGEPWHSSLPHRHTGVRKAKHKPSAPGPPPGPLFAVSRSTAPAVGVLSTLLQNLCPP